MKHLAWRLAGIFCTAILFSACLAWGPFDESDFAHYAGELRLID